MFFSSHLQRAIESTQQTENVNKWRKKARGYVSGRTEKVDDSRLVQLHTMAHSTRTPRFLCLIFWL